MRIPYQCMTRCGDILVAARGSSIDSFKLEDGSLLSTWNCPSSQHSQSGGSLNGESDHTTKLTTIQTSELSSVEIAIDISSPPAKKRKLSQSGHVPTPIELKNGKKKKQNNRTAAVASGLEAAAVTVLVSTTIGKHVIAVTGEDKSIRVFEHVFIHGAHQLEQLSQRNMPKRPCTIVITDDNSTIISADKFGDVYGLPLLPSEEEVVKSQHQTPEPVSSKPFVPAANELTIHSQRNRKALENQKRHGNQAPEKSEPTFQHKLLLGHVSMLTDVALAISENKNYIITADRDEHIRVSRSIPQSHIIEGFCLGHTEFISRLCIPKSRSDLLISAGGDDDLFVWNWISSKIVSKANLKKHVEALKTKISGSGMIDDSAGPLKVAVSGLYHTRKDVNGKPMDFIIVTCEGVPALFLFNLRLDDNSLQHIQTFELPGNPLAVQTHVPLPITDSSEDVVISIDIVHLPGSTTERRSDASETDRALLGVQLRDTYLVSSEAAFNESIESCTSQPQNFDSKGQLSNLLYNLENLRKRDGEDE